MCAFHLSPMLLLQLSAAQHTGEDAKAAWDGTFKLPVLF